LQLDTTPNLVNGATVPKTQNKRGKASVRIREIYREQPHLSVKAVHAMLVQEKIKCSVGLISSVRCRMKKPRGKRKSNIVYMKHLLQMKRLATEMGVDNFKAVIKILYSTEGN
jgi:hypothetical protein